MFHMEQKYSKDIKLEIVIQLLKEKNHIRNLARAIITNHTTVIRKVKELLNENILDYKLEGKNKVYFLKKTGEAKTLIISAELYKLNKTLKKYPRLRAIIESLQKNKKINLVLLFGSYSKELAKEDSDIDIYISPYNLKIKEEIQRENDNLSIKGGEYNLNDPLVKEIEKDHVIIKGFENYYEQNRFFE